VRWGFESPPATGNGSAPAGYAGRFRCVRGFRCSGSGAPLFWGSVRCSDCVDPVRLEGPAVAGMIICGSGAVPTPKRPHRTASGRVCSQHLLADVQTRPFVDPAGDRLGHGPASPPLRRGVSSRCAVVVPRLAQDGPVHAHCARPRSAWAPPRAQAHCPAESGAQGGCSAVYRRRHALLPDRPAPPRDVPCPRGCGDCPSTRVRGRGSARPAQGPRTKRASLDRWSSVTRTSVPSSTRSR
jgi:hypothetical protein